MAEEELGHNSGLPREIVKQAKKIFSDKNDVESCVIEKVKNNLSTGK